MAARDDTGKRILMVEDDELFSRTMGRMLDPYYRVDVAIDVAQAIRALSESPPDLVLLDLMLGRESGMDVLEHLRRNLSPLPVVMLSAIDRIPQVVQAIKAGATDYLVKPVRPDELLLTLEKALETVEMRAEVERRRHLQLESNRDFELIGTSAAMARIREEIARLGPSDAPVLITGETGTGKELVARGIHAASERRSGPLVAVNCGAIPKDLFEAEFFGHRRGAFTGAQTSAPGKFQLAHRGTLLLDEVGELPLETQVKLLRVIETQELYPVGASTLVRVDVRIVASTHRDLETMIEEGTFREDLYFRLNVCTIQIPPLREHPDDAVVIARHFIEQARQRSRNGFSALSPEAEGILLRHPWRGNVRELHNAIERVLISDQGPLVTEEHLRFLDQRRGRSNRRSFELPEQGLDIEDLEKTLMLQALERAKGNKSQAARLLGLSPPTFYYRLEKYGIARGEE